MIWGVRLEDGVGAAQQNAYGGRKTRERRLDQSFNACRSNCPRMSSSSLSPWPAAGSLV
jgi:hypothetical protein